MGGPEQCATLVVLGCLHGGREREQFALQNIAGEKAIVLFRKQECLRSRGERACFFQDNRKK